MVAGEDVDGAGESAIGVFTGVACKTVGEAARFLGDFEK